jgi:prevent-host-death family protein
MARVTLVDFRRNAERVLRRVGRGERLILTRRGHPVARLEPVAEPAPTPDDPIYHLADFAAKDGVSLTNREMDRIIYGA